MAGAVSTSTPPSEKSPGANVQFFLNFVSKPTTRLKPRKFFLQIFVKSLDLPVFEVNPSE